MPKPARASPVWPARSLSQRLLFQRGEVAHALMRLPLPEEQRIETFEVKEARRPGLSSSISKSVLGPFSS